jgi:preprotein translocase subunit SecF
MLCVNNIRKYKDKTTHMWYSNVSLKWIWMRSILVALVGCLVVIAIWGTDKVNLLIAVLCAPLVLGVFNSIFRTSNNSSDG